MASEIRVNKIENRSGLGTVTFADTGVDLAGIVTATTFSGSGASLTNIPDSALSAVTASKLTGALPAISGANLTGIAATDNVRTGILDVAGISTFRNTMNVGAAVTISESGIEASGIGITVANINGGQIGGRRNIVINGAMNIAQRGTSSTANGYNSVDRFAVNFDSGLTEAPTQAQVTLSSSDTPYSSGFRYALKITNGNQTSQDANDYIQIAYKIEAQDIAQSGWNYTSSSSNITLSFWVKASIAQTMYARLNAEDTSSSNARAFSFAFSATTSWTKITKTIPGNSTLVFNNDTGVGIALYIIPFYGTSYTTSGHTNDAWIVDSGSDQVTDMATTWFSGNDATLEVTGVQLEVGSQATAFEHRSHAEELTLCQRYYQVIAKGSEGTSGIRAPLVSGAMWGAGQFYGVLTLKTKMRTIPSLDVVNGTDYWQVYNNTTDTCDTLAYNNASPDAISLYLSGNLSGTAQVGAWSRTNNAAAFVAAKAEL